MTPQQKELVAHMVKELETPYKRLTSWEENFVESVTSQWEEKHYLSEKQIEILERIYAEKTA